MPLDGNSQCVCKQTVDGGKWIQCSAEGCCSKWWHIVCAGLANIPDSAVKKMKYTCPKCAIAAVGLKCIENTQYTKDIAYEIKRCLPEIVQAVVKETSEVVSKSYADIVKEENKVLLKETVKTTSKNTLKIMQDREIRDKNVVIFNVAESTKENREECFKDDDKFFTQLCEQIQIDRPEVIKISRIGKKSEDKKRPVKVCFGTLFEKRKFFANLYHLKDAHVPFKNVQIQHDLTLEERQITRDLVNKANEKNKEENPTDFLYKVRGSPGSMKIVKIYKKHQTG